MSQSPPEDDHEDREAEEQEGGDDLNDDDPATVGLVRQWMQELDGVVQEVERKTMAFRAGLIGMCLLTLLISAVAIAVAATANSKASRCADHTTTFGRRLEAPLSNNAVPGKGPRCVPVVSCYEHQAHAKAMRKEERSKHEL